MSACEPPVCGEDTWRNEPAIPDLWGNCACLTGTIAAMLAELKELWKFRELLFSSISRELKVRYKNSVLGFMWSLINPLLTVLVMTLVFKVFLGLSVRNYTAYILAAYLPYLFFQSALMDAAQSVNGSLGLIKKIYFPREIIPLSIIIANFVHFAMAIGVFFLFLLTVWIVYPDISPFQITTLYLPVLLLIQFFLTAGIGLLISALNVFYEDVKYIVGVILYLLFFLCPIMYFSEMVHHKTSAVMYFIYNLNPVAALCTGYRKVLLAPQPVQTGEGTFTSLPLDWTFIAIAGAISIISLVIGYAVFNRLKWKFVERP